MNRWSNLNNLITTLKSCLASDELEDTLFYLKEYRRLKKNELNEMKLAKKCLEDIHKTIGFNDLK